MTARSHHIVICNERLLPRFGVDRLLLLVAGGLRLRGHRVTFVCQRCDRDAAVAVSPSLVEMPELGSFDLYGAEAEALRLLRERWQAPVQQDKPDLVITGGWPFFRVAEVCADLRIPSLFIDAGAVPHDGMSQGSVALQRSLRHLRAQTLPNFTSVLPISNFIRDTQTVPERGTTAGVRTVRLGADHMDAPMFRAPGGDTIDTDSLAQIRKLSEDGYRLILLLGRFEPEGYKNSLAAFDVLARILKIQPKVRLLILAREHEIHPPATIRQAVVPLDYISDVALGEIMVRCEFGLSMSKWEGFNLPLVEMQWSGRPVLAFNLGAHPEVTADPWLLCEGVTEMADKAIRLLQSGTPEHILTEDRFRRFRDRFRWHDVLARYVDIVERLIEAPAPVQPRVAPPGRPILVDCTNAAIDPANPGVIRVARRLGHALQQDSALFPVFVRWHMISNTYRTLSGSERATLATYDGPTDGVSSIFSPGGQGEWPIDNILDLLRSAPKPPVLFLPEVVLDGRFPERLAWARARGMVVAALLYDLIPVTHAPFCSPSVVARFPEYLEAMAATDAVWAISKESLVQFELYTARHSLPLPPRREAIWLPAQFGSRPRVAAPPISPALGQSHVVLCVGSIEPRKNHRRLIEAFRSLLQRRPDLPIRLVLAGHRFGGADELAEWIIGVTREEARITWTGLVTDDQLAALFESATYTAYPSLVEGYGLPVVESLWMGRPCLCHSGGVMNELAAGGGCLTVDMADAAAIEIGLERLAEDAELRNQLTQQALRTALLDWATYGSEIARRLRIVQDKAYHDPDIADENPIDVDDGAIRDLEYKFKTEVRALLLRPDRFVTLADKSVSAVEATAQW